MDVGSPLSFPPLGVDEPAIAQPTMDTFCVSVPTVASALSASTNSVEGNSDDVETRLVDFRRVCRRPSVAVLPLPQPRSLAFRRRQQPEAKACPARPLRRSIRVATRRVGGSSVKRQQKVLISRLGLALEGEKITEDSLLAYIKLFEPSLSALCLRIILGPFCLCLGGSLRSRLTFWLRRRR